MKGTNKPKISIVTVTYNAVETLEKTIESVINQTYSNKEYIIVDGNSTDGTIDIIKKFNNHISIWISEKDKGIYDAMNKAASLATGDWIIFINSGDSFYKNDILQNIFESNDWHETSKYDVIYGNTRIFDIHGSFIILGRNIRLMKIKMPFCHQSCIMRTKILRSNPFDLKYKISADYNLFYHLYLKKFKFKYINKTISNYNNEGYSQKNELKMYKENYQINNQKIIYSYIYIKTFIRKLFSKKIS